MLNRLVKRNGRSGSPLRLEEFALLPGAEAAVAALKQAGLLVIVVTNQPEVARRQLAPTELERMHAELRRSVPVDAIYTCPHEDADGCLCRKPKPGLLLRARDDWQINLAESYLVGDGRKDIEAGHAAGCVTFFIGSGSVDASASGTRFVVTDLPTAARLIAARYAGLAGLQI